MNKINHPFTALHCLVKAKTLSSVNTIYSMHYLDPNRVRCNCAKSSMQEKVLLSYAATTAASQLQMLSVPHINNDDGLRRRRRGRIRTRRSGSRGC